MNVLAMIAGALVPVPPFPGVHRAVEYTAVEDDILDPRFFLLPKRIGECLGVEPMERIVRYIERGDNAHSVPTDMGIVIRRSALSLMPHIANRAIIMIVPSGKLLNDVVDQRYKNSLPADFGYRLSTPSSCSTPSLAQL